MLRVRFYGTQSLLAEYGKISPIKKWKVWSSCCGAAETNPTSIHEDAGSVPGLDHSLSGSAIGIAVSCRVGHRHCLDPTLLWLWCRPAAAALIPPLAWELPYPRCSSKKDKKKKKKWKFWHREQICGCQGGMGVVRGFTGSLGLVAANYYIQDRSTTRSYSSIGNSIQSPGIDHDGR